MALRLQEEYVIGVDIKQLKLISAGTKLAIFVNFLAAVFCILSACMNAYTGHRVVFVVLLTLAFINILVAFKMCRMDLK